MKKEEAPVYEVYVAGFDKMELYHVYEREEEAISAANTLRKHETGTISVYKVERIYGC